MPSSSATIGKYERNHQKHHTATYLCVGFRTQWPDQEAHQTSVEFLQLIVMPAGRFVHPPVVAPHEKAIFAVELGMYGLNTVPPVGEAAGASAVIKTADGWLAVMKMTDKKIAVAPSLLYK